MVARTKTLLRLLSFEMRAAPAGAAPIPHCFAVKGAVAARSLRRRSPLLECLEDRHVPASFQGLGDLTGGIFSSYASGVSSDGSIVVGGSSVGSDYQAFRWTAVGGMADLGDLAGYDQSWANGMSADGSVVVGHRFLNPYYEAFRWTAAGGTVGLGDLPNGTYYSAAKGVSADGSVVVGSSSGGSGTEAFRWTAAGGMVGLGDLPGGVFFSSAHAVSADGSVVVGQGNGNAVSEAFRWTAAGGMVGLGDLPGGEFNSAAWGVSADGSVVVGSSSGGSGTEAFRWTAAGGIVGLGDLPGGTFSSGASGVSADASVVVGWGNGSAGQEAFRWTTAGGMRSVRDILVTDYGLAGQLAGWTLSSASACSADGSVIVGSGTNPAGQTEAWIARLDGPPHVASVQVNAGEVQRSRVTSLTIRFNSQVMFSGPAEQAFAISRIGGGAINFSLNVSVESGASVVVLTNFTGSETEFGSLRDGRYTLTALASQISSGGQALDGNADGTPGGNYGVNFHRLFGDADGNAAVTASDFNALRLAYGGGPSIFDFNGDGSTSASDFNEFRSRYGVMLTP